MDDMDRFLATVRETARILPRSSIEVVCHAIVSTPVKNWKYFVRGVLQLVPLETQRHQVATMLQVWHDNAPGLSADAVQIALATAVHCVEATLREHSMELVSTGPDAGTALRRTDQALLQLIRSAQHDLLLVTFAAYKMPAIMEALTDAIHRGVRFRFVAEGAEHDSDKTSFNPAGALGTELAAHTQVYVWPFERRHVDKSGRHGSLHAKCAVADHRLLFLSSANLTEYAHNLNMEMGLLIQSGTLPSQVTDHFDSLMRNKILVLISK